MYHTLFLGVCAFIFTYIQASVKIPNLRHIVLYVIRIQNHFQAKILSFPQNISIYLHFETK